MGGGIRLTVPEGLTLAPDDHPTSLSKDDNSSNEPPPLLYMLLSEDGFSSTQSQSGITTTVCLISC